MEDTNLFIVSACLVGVRCRYDGDSKPHPKVLALLRAGRAIPVCPEQLGGLTTPRASAERRDDRVITTDGRDVSREFRQGAEQAVRIARLAGCRKAILKARSPSCGKGRIYDGTFTGTLVDGDGVCAALCTQHGIDVISEEEL